MHMSDALLSPAVGVVAWGAAAATIAVSSRKVTRDLDTRRVPLMGTLGAFVFAAQMVNFAIPGTGSSGHLGGGLLLAILLGPHAGFLVLVSVLVIQALFFADGGILALGANILNMGVFTCFFAYPLIYRPMVGKGAARGRVYAAAIVASTLGLAAGATAVTVETALSGISSLPFGPFLATMVPIHLAIGLVEGFVTATVVVIARSVEPGIDTAHSESSSPRRRRAMVFGLLAAAIVIGGAVSLLASGAPDGLEWSVARVAGAEEITGTSDPVTSAAGWLQEKLSFLPDYAIRTAPSSSTGTTLSGIAGGALTVVVVFLAALALRHRSRRRAGGRHADD